MVTIDLDVPSELVDAARALAEARQRVVSLRGQLHEAEIAYERANATYRPLYAQALVALRYALPVPEETGRSRTDPTNPPPAPAPPTGGTPVATRAAVGGR